jgi:hypothetical protein
MHLRLFVTFRSRPDNISAARATQMPLKASSALGMKVAYENRAHPDISKQNSSLGLTNGGTSVIQRAVVERRNG